MGLGLEARGLMEDGDQLKSCHGPQRHGENWMNSAAGAESGCVGGLQEDWAGRRGRARAGAAGEAAGGLWALSAAAHIRSAPTGCCLESLGL